MADLVEGTYATGAGVFRPGRDFTPDPDSSSDGGAGEDDTIDPVLQQGTRESISFAAATPAISAPTPAVPTTMAATSASTTTGATAPSPINATTSQPSRNALSRKRDATESDELTSTKRQRGHGRKQSSSQAITGMASSIAQLATAVASDAVIASPQRKTAAIRAIEDDGDLSDHEQIAVFRVIRRDTAFADTILAISKKDTRTLFIKSELYGDD